LTGSPFLPDAAGDAAIAAVLKQQPLGKIHPQGWMIEPETRTVFAALAADGAEVRFIGGCVRDTLMKREVRDIDLALAVAPATTLALLQRAGIRAIPTGIDHGTVTAVIENRHFEITSLRVDVETDGRRAKVAFTDDWVADAARRDFTFNALSCTLAGDIYDYFDGLEDLGHGRVRFVGNPPPPEALYFRGPVLAAFDGREWTRLTPSFTPAFRQVTDLQLRGTPVRYEVTLEPSRLALLPLLEATPDRPDSAPALPGIETSMRPDLQWQSSQPITERVRFEAQAWPLFRHGPRVPVLGLRDLVALPPGYNPRTLAWAAEFRREPRHAEADARTLANAVLAHIRKNDFSYTLAPGPYGRDAVDEFWLDRKLGFCEHFAASFVVVMRALDVPARIVTGYQGTDPFPVDGYYAVRQSHAHAWAEYWQPGEGWVRADPTAAVAPDRISRSLSLRPVPGFVEQAIGGVSPQLLANLRGLWEAFDNRWNQSVLNFSRNQQYNLLRSLGIDAPNWIDLAYVLIILLCGASLAGAAWALWDRHRQDPWQRLQLQVQSRLRALGVHVGPHDGPGTRARRVRSALGAGAEPLAAALESLERQRYGAGGRSRVDRRWWREFQAAAQRVVTASPMPRRAESTS
jgi:transglutaminase-like putative cysteine protease